MMRFQQFASALDWLQGTQVSARLEEYRFIPLFISVDPSIGLNIAF
jgi:hypothetical protein